MVVRGLLLGVLLGLLRALGVRLIVGLERVQVGRGLVCRSRGSIFWVRVLVVMLGPAAAAPPASLSPTALVQSSNIAQIWLCACSVRVVTAAAAAAFIIRHEVRVAGSHRVDTRCA